MQQNLHTSLLIDKYLSGGLNHETEKAIGETVQGLRRP